MIANRIAVKVGTSTITNEKGAIDYRAIDNLCKVLSAVENGGNGYRAYGATVHPGNPRMGRMHNVILPALPITLSVSVSSPTSITGACRTR